jgi:cytidyltransferase-like protein
MIVFTNGCFDCLHPGHFNLLTYCRSLAGPEGKVIVALDSDEKIRKDKGCTRPIFTYDERLVSILSLMGTNGKSLVDTVVPFSTNDELHIIIGSLRPDLLVKDSEWKGNVIGSDIAEVKYFPRDLRHSTTKIVDKIWKIYREY